MAKTRSYPFRIFVVAWLAYSLHFSTNIVREHYPAFALVDKGSFRVDDYHDLHSDIFRHRVDGHYYIGNQVAASVLVALPLLVFDPLLDAVEAYDLRNSAARGNATDFASEYPNRQAYMAKVRARGLALRFGAASVVTSLFFTAPLAAALVASFFGLLLRRGIPVPRATGVALLYAFATPLFYRASHLNHNLVMAAAVWWSFFALDEGRRAGRLSNARLAVAGFLAGLTLALDYAGVITLASLWLFAVFAGNPARTVIRRAVGTWPFVAGSLLPIAFLLYSQWAMYGNPFLPGQYWMTPVHYTDEGFRGMAWPAADLFLGNLLHPDWGLLAFAPIFVLALVPESRRVDPAPSLFDRPAGRFIAGLSVAFLVFCAANQYSRMQWNTGFRYLLPLVPLLFLVAARALCRWPAKLVFGIGTASVAHQWVLCMARFTPVDWQDGRRAVFESWHRVLSEGPQLPALKVAAGALPRLAWLGSPWVAALLLAGLVAISFGLLRAQLRTTR